MPGEHPLALHCNDIDRHTDNFLSPGAFFSGVEAGAALLLGKLWGDYRITLDTVLPFLTM